MESTYSHNKTYNGNLFWIFETLKTVNKEINFDKPVKNSDYEEIMIYECIVFNEDREDSLFLQVEV